MSGLGIPAARIRVTQIPPDHRDVVKLFQRKVVQYRNQPGDERADFQQYDPEGQAITTDWGGHEPTLPIPDPRPLGGLLPGELQVIASFGRAKFLKLTGLVVDSVHPDPKSKSLATRCIFLQAARDHEDDHHTHPKELGRDCD